MKSVIVIILCLSLFAGCTDPVSTVKNNETVKPENIFIDRLEEVALQHLFDRIRKLPQATFKDNEIHIGDTSIRLEINIEHEDQKGDNFFYAVNTAANYKAAGQEYSIIIGSIGVGTNKEEAINVCMQEWFATFGIPFTDMLTGNKGVSVADMHIFSGIMGIRGNLPEGTWLKGDDEMTKKIISQIQQQVKAQTSKIIPIDIKLVIGKNGVTNGECRIDNEVSTALLDDLKQLSWPSSDESYMLKQFYLVEKMN